MKRLPILATFSLVTLVPTLAAACVMFRISTTTPFEYLIYGALFGAFGVARRWTLRAPPEPAVLLRRFGGWMVVFFAIGVAFARDYAIADNMVTRAVALSSLLILAGILFRGWQWVRWMLVIGGMCVAFAWSWNFTMTAVESDFEPGYFDHPWHQGGSLDIE